MPERSVDPLTRVTAYVAAFDEAVTSGSWADLGAWFAEDAELHFPGTTIPPAHGRAAIVAAYEARPPNETIGVVTAVPDPVRPEVDEVRYVWSSGEPGRMSLRWEDGLVARLDVHLG